MSYILEALRKAEQQRHAEPSPVLVAPQHYPQPVRQIRYWKRWAVFIFMLNGAVIGILWFSPQATVHLPARTNHPAPTEHPNSPPAKGEYAVGGRGFDLPQREVAPVLPVPTAVVAIEAEKPVLAPKPVKKIPDKPAVAAAVILPTVLPPQPEPIAITLQPPEEAPLPEPVAVPTPPPAYQQIPTLHELSAEFQQSLPPLPINVFVYHTDPQQRFVLIGMRKYQEGQAIQGGPVLEAITPDSLVLHQAGRYFRIIRP